MEANVVFDLGTILSVTTPILLTNIENLYEILNYMTGDNLFTHQLPRAANEMCPVILEQYPQLKDVDTTGVNRENWKEFLDEMIVKYGSHLPISPCGLFSHKKIDPQEEMISMLNGDESKLLLITPDFLDNEGEQERLKRHLRDMNE